MQLLITCPYGLWSLLASELKKLWFQPQNTFETGTFVPTDMHGMMNINLWSRIANKVYIQLCEWETKTFDQLFDLIKHSNYEQYLSNTQLSIKTQSKNSQLSSLRTIQSIAHKALLDSMVHFWKEEPRIAELFLSLDHNKAALYLNTSWAALHQRSWRKQTWLAPLKENLATALLLLAWWKFKSPLIDPFCGSGTIAIEAALLAKNHAPGLQRNFAFEQFKNFEAWAFQQLKIEAETKQFKGNYQIFAYDHDPKMIAIAKENAKQAGVAELIHFEQKDFLKTDYHFSEKFWIVTNPPYGKRLENQNLDLLYTKLKNQFKDLAFWGWISSHTMQDMKKELRNEKKLFNGNESCSFWSRKIGM